MDKNLFLAVGLSLAVYAVWFGLIEKRVLPPGSQLPQSAQTSAQVPGAERAPASAAPQTAATLPDETPAAKEKFLAGAQSAAFGNATAEISPRGAGFVSWKETEALGIVELIENPVPGFFSTFPELTFSRDTKAAGLVYTARRSDGASITKEFVPEGPNALPKIKITIENPTAKPIDSGAWTLSIGPGLGTIESQKLENEKIWRAVGLPDGKQKAEDIKPGAHSVDYRWVAVDNRYFLAAVVPSPADFDHVDSVPEMNGRIATPKLLLTAKSGSIAPKSSRKWEIPYYVGAKGFRWLSHYGVDLDRAINFGFFHPIGRFVLRTMLRLHDLIGNFGWSIILLTILIQVLMFPFTYKSLESMAKMRRLQPEIQRLQQRYAKDQVRLSQETMELYKKEGANPLGGCLPMLVQMPILYGFYAALQNSWELHGARWILWVKDLSAADALFGHLPSFFPLLGGYPVGPLPILMGVVMFFQNKMNSIQASDPAQQQMMTWMPIIFTLMFMKFPAGLVLYWLTNSLVSTLQQVALRNKLNPPTPVRR